MEKTGRIYHRAKCVTLNGCEWMKAKETITLIYILGKFAAISQISGTDGFLRGWGDVFAQVIIRPIWINCSTRGQCMSLFFIRTSPAILQGSGRPEPGLVSTNDLLGSSGYHISSQDENCDSGGILLTSN